MHGTELLTAIQKRVGDRGYRGKGIGLASDYLAVVRDAMPSGRLATFLKGGSEAAWAKALKDAESKLVYRAERMDVLGGSHNEAGTVKRFGQPSESGVAEGLTDKSVMDFDCILTTKDLDRDGDVLDPLGADIDSKMPLLWQHLPLEPIGRFVKMIDRNRDLVSCRFAIADTELGRDAAVLTEFGALRVSHGFQPISFDPMDKDGSDLGGWNVKAFEVMEGSLVSIPSNKGAVITAFSREKLRSPLVKSWAGKLFKERPAQSNGWRESDHQAGMAAANLTTVLQGVVDPMDAIDFGDMVRHCWDNRNADKQARQLTTKSTSLDTTA